MKSIEIAAGVLEYASKVLCVRRGYNELSYVAFKWEFPGGKIEVDESPVRALVREIKEELSIEIIAGEKIMTVNHQYPDFYLTMHAYFCTSDTDVITLREHTSYEWCSRNSLKQFDWLEADIPLVEKLCKSHR